jgi:hypothetical protein
MNYKEIEELAGHRQVSAWVIKLVNDAIAIERKECAKVVEDYADSLGETGKDYGDAIRARGTHEQS